MAASAALVAAACGSSSSTSSAPSSSGSSAVPQISAASFNLTFDAMTTIKPLAAKGKGKVAVILPDTVSSTRYVEFDAPYLKKSFQLAGLSSTDTIIQNAQGSDATQYSDAQADITNGATVLVVDPLDSGVGARIESYAKSHGVPVIDYDRLTLGGTRKYYVSFNNIYVGTLLGKGLVSCITAWNVQEPAGHRHARRPDRQQRHAVRQRLPGRAAAPVLGRDVQGRGQPGRDLGPAHRADRVPGGVHGAPEHQRRADAQRRERRADHPLPAAPRASSR